jgi:hypothetical protein
MKRLHVPASRPRNPYVVPSKRRKAGPHETTARRLREATREREMEDESEELLEEEETDQDDEDI